MKSRFYRIIFYPVPALIAAILFGIVFSAVLLSRSPSAIEQNFDSTVPGLTIHIEYPSTITIKHSYVIRISLIPETTSLISSIVLNRPTVVSNNPTPLSSAGPFPVVVEGRYPTPIITPGSSLLQARGRGYDPSSIALLSGVDPDLTTDTFMIQPNDPPQQSLNQSEVNWEWTITPEESGEHQLVLIIELQWKSTEGSRQGVSAQPYTYSLLNFGETEMSFNVRNEFPDIDWSSVITSVLSGALLAFVIWFSAGFWGVLKDKQSQL